MMWIFTFQIILGFQAGPAVKIITNNTITYAYAICLTKFILASQNLILARQKQFGRPKSSKSYIKNEDSKIFGQPNIFWTAKKILVEQMA